MTRARYARPARARGSTVRLHAPPRGGHVDGNVTGAGPTATVADVRGASKRFGDQVGRPGPRPRRSPSGTILGVIGPSGAGKTTTIRMLTGALRPTTGRRASSASGPTAFRRATRERIGYMPQQFTLYPDLTARENVDFVASLFGLLRRRRWRRTKEVLKLVELWDAREPPGERDVGRHAAPPGARERARPRAGADLPRRADGRASTRSCGRRSGTSSTAFATPAGRSSSRPSTSARRRSATGSH